MRQNNLRTIPLCLYSYCRPQPEWVILCRKYILSFILLLSLLLCKQSSFAQLTAGFTVNGQSIPAGDTLDVCKGNALIYASTATGAYTAINWTFNLGTPNTFTLPSPPAIVYNTTGIDSAIQIVSNATTSDTFFIIIKVTDVLPVVDFTHNNNVCSGTPQQFNPTVTGTAPYTYAWTFGGGGTASASNPVHTFTSLGCGTTSLSNTLTVTDATGCSGTITKPITILQAPDVALQDPDAIPFSNCENSPTPTNPNFVLTVNNVSPDAGCITSYTLDWGDGNVVSSATFPATHTYTQIGAFNLVVTATAANGCVSTKSYVVANQTNPAGSLGTLGTTTNLCAPAIVPFTIGNWQINSPGTLYILDFGDGNSVTLTHPLNPTFSTDTVYHTYTTTSCPASSFTATLTVVNACGSTPYSAGGIQVLEKAESAFTVPASSFCVGQNVCFNNTTQLGFGPFCTNTSNTTWDFGDGSPPSTAYSPCHTYTAPGIYTVTLTTNNYCGPSVFSLQVCITTPPVPGFTLDNITGCAPFIVSATNTTTALNNCLPVAGYSWSVSAYTPDFCGTSSSWGFANGTNANSANPSFVFNNAGTYTITLAVTNACGTFTFNRTVTVKRPPAVALTPVANACGTVSLAPAATVNACGNSPLTYAWTFGGGTPATSSNPNPGTVTFAGAGVHIISLSVTNECGTTTVSQQFTIDTVTVANAGPAQNMCGTTATMAANNAVIGTGVWSIVSGPNVPAITNTTSPVTTITGLIPGVYVFRWTITSGTCTSVSDVTITIQSGPTPAAAGADQQLCLVTSTTLAGNTPLVGTGLWSYVSGPGGYTITNPSSPGTTVTGLVPGVYVFRWTTSFANCAPSTDDVRVTIFANPSTADAGTDQTICAATAALAGNTPVVGTGLWSYVSGPSLPSFTNPASPATNVNGLVPGTYILKWTISNGNCPPSEDQVEIIVPQQTTAAAAGPDQSVCAATSITLAGNTPVVGSGVWSYVSGPAGYNITNPSSPSTTVTGLIPGGTYIFQWTITNSVCPPGSDQVQVIINDNVTIADAGTTQDMCGTSATMAGNTPVIGTGLWSYVSGPSGYTIINPSSPSTTITGLVPGTYVFRWTITNGSCSSSSDVTIVIQSGPTPAAAGADQQLCLATSTTLTGNTPVIGTGMWTYVSGPAGYSIVTPASPVTDITGLVPGVYVFRWTTSFANCTPTTDDVQVTVYANPTTANAGADQTICASTVTLAGNTPTIGTGTWTYVSGPPGYSITNPSLPNSTVTGLVPGTYVFKWTISNGVCPFSEDNIQVVVTAQATVAMAGPDQTLCAATNTTLAGNSAIIGTGAWTYVSGPAGYSITDPSLPNSTITGLIPGSVYVFQWTITNGVCPPSTDQVQINDLNALQGSISSPVTVICAGQQVTITGSNPTGGTGTYSYQWQQSMDGTTWANIPSATAQNYTAVLTDSVYFRCRISSLPCEIFSNVVFIAVQPAVSNNIIAANQGICINTTAATITGSPPTGGDGNYTYQWQQSTDGISWTDISGATNADYSPGVLVQTVYFRRMVNTVLCNGPQANISNVVTITVNNDSRALFTANPVIDCAPFDLNTAITVTPFPDRNGLYQWWANGVPIGSSTTGTFPGYVIASPGSTVMIKLKTTSQYGCKPDSMEIPFTTVETAIAGFTKTPASGCGPLTVTFTNTSTILNSSIQYFWNFGNGILSTNMQPGAVTFANSPVYRDTTYYITLKAYNGCDTTYHRDSVKVFPDSKARFGVDTTRGCSPFTIHIQNISGGNNFAYYWDFGDGTTDTTTATGPMTHTYFTGTIRDYTIRLISENQCTRDTQTTLIVVSPNTIQPFISANGNQLAGCAPHVVAFNNSSVGASQLTWNFGDGSPLVVTPNSQDIVTHTFNSPGTFNVSIRLQNDCSDTTVSRSITVYAPPVASFTPNPAQVCTSQPVTVANTSANANSYEWQWGDGNTSTFASGQHTYNAAGPYIITLIAKNVHSSGFICYDTTTRNVVVMDKIPAQIVVAPGRPCVPYTLNVNAGNISGYSAIKWVIYDSSTAQDEFHLNGPSATHVYDVPGTYAVKLILFTTPTCVDSIMYEFQVHPTPKTTFDPQLVKTCSHDTTVSYLAVTTEAGGEPVNYKWFINGSIEGTTNPFSYNFQAPLNNTLPVEFIIQALAENTAGCGDTSLAGKLIIHPLPYPKIVVTPSVVLQQPDYQFGFRDTAVTNPDKTWTWFMGDHSLQTKNGREITYTYGDTGTYTVRCHVIDFSTGCNAMDSVKVTVLYVPGYLYVPNAMCLGCSNAGLRQFLPLGKGLKTYRLRIYNAWGQKIFETDKLDANGSPSEPWNGTYGGKPNSPVLQQDVYSWQIEATYTNGTEWKGMVYPGSNKAIKAGFITIVK